MNYPNVPGSPAQTPTCYRHPDRATYVRCNRCQRPICPDCMRSAAVGHQCVECVRAGAATVRTAKTPFGGTVRAGAAPVVTWSLIGINVAMFVLQMASGQLERELTLWPPAVADGQWYRLVTSMFLHYGAMHILFNMWALYVVGPPLEAWFGRLRFAALYLLAGLGGSVLVYLIAPLNTATAGASGAIFGLFGAFLVVSRRLKLDIRGVIAIIVINLVFTFVGPALGAGAISWQGHVGGLVTGAGVAAAYAYAPRERRTAVQAAATVGVLVVFLVLIWWRTNTLLDLFGVR